MKHLDVLRRNAFLHDQAAQLLRSEAEYKIEHHERDANRLLEEAAPLQEPKP